MSTDIAALIPDLQRPCQALIDLAHRAGLQPRITSTLRSRAEQERLYRRYLAGANPYPAAPPGRSAHEYGYAFDMVVAGEENQNDLGTVWEQWGGVWGGHVRDPVHFEYPGFAVPQEVAAEDVPATPAFLKLADLIASFSGLGTLQVIEWLVNLADPASGKWDTVLRNFINAPFETLYQLGASL